MSDLSNDPAGAPGDTSTVTNLVAAATATAEGYDISNEQYRYYTYPNGDRFTITDPATLYIVKGSHRVVDIAGVTHRPERGYVGISWKVQDGKQPFDF